MMYQHFYSGICRPAVNVILYLYAWSFFYKYDVMTKKRFFLNTLVKQPTKSYVFSACKIFA